MDGIYLLVGSNLGDRLRYLKYSKEFISKWAQVVTCSSVYESAPWGVANQPWFLNAVLKIETELKPNEVLEEIKLIESSHGRKRVRKWGERTLDIDILYYHDEIIDDIDLVVPHKAIQDRRFTLIPLCEVAPTELHPILLQDHKKLLSICPDELEVKKTNLFLSP